MSSYAVSDLHGCYNQWRQIQSFCKDSDRIYVLGDCIDRGPDSFDTLKSVMRDPRTTLLCGNHEDMMLQTLIDEQDEDEDLAFWLWSSNGGRKTYDEWQEDGRKFDWIPTLKALPLWARYTNQEGYEIIMTHSGVTPKAGFDISSCSRKSFLWDRKHTREQKWHRYDNEIIVHGHTPVILMPHFENKDVIVEPGAFWYCDDHKCNIDNCGFETGYICLLDLDTFDEHIFYN